MNKEYINNLETGKIELHFTKEEYQNLSEDLKKELKSNYLFSRYANAWVSRSKNNHYYALKVAEKLGFTQEKIQGERLTYEEELNRKAERAERKIERYEEYSINAEKRGEQLQSEFNSLRGDIAFITQPIIRGHKGSESFANRRNKIMNRYTKGFEEYRKSDYFKEKMRSAQNTANKTQLNDRIYLSNRIKECKAIIKKYESYIVNAEEKLNNGDVEAEKRIEKYLSELEYQMDKQAFMENCLDNLGGIFSKENIKEGYLINARHGWMKVKKVNTKTVMAEFIENNGLLGMTSKVEFAEIKEIKIPSDYKEEKDNIVNPYKVNDILVQYNAGGHWIIGAYQVIKTTQKGVTLQKINIDNDNKPIKDGFKIDKPFMKKIVKSNYRDFIGVYMDGWQLYLYEKESIAI